MAMVLSCMALEASVWRSASAKVALTGVYICPVIALQAYLRHISSFSIDEIEAHGGHTTATYSTVSLSVTMYVDRKTDFS